MQVGPGIISSRMFARNDRPVPNIVAIYEKPRLKVRRDATHVLGGMFGWNAPEEMARALRNDDSATEESTSAIASIPNSAAADASLSGPSQQCLKHPVKRSKRRTAIPLAEMGASILSLSLQERMNRQQGVADKGHHEPISTLVKSPVAPLDNSSTVLDSAVKVKKIKLAAPGDHPTTKKLRLTIGTAPPSAVSVSTPLLQLPLSPPDTSSNASKAPNDERYTGPASSTPRTAQLPMPNFELDLSNITGLSLSTLDSDSESDSSSESSSESSSDSPDLSSSTSTRSEPQVKAKGKEKDAAQSAPNNKSRTSTPSVAAPSTGDPSTPPRRKRRTHPPGWVGWVQTEESPDHSRLIRLDDVPVILGRRTRSGKEFADLPSRRRSTAPTETKGKRPTKGQNSKQESAGPEEQNRGATEETVETKMDGEHTPDVTKPGPSVKAPRTGVLEPLSPVLVTSIPNKDVTTPPASPDKTASALKRNDPSLGESTSRGQPVRGTNSPVKNSNYGLSTPRPSSISVPTVLKLTRSDTIITPTGGRPNESQRKEASPVKDSPSKSSGRDKTKSLGDLPMRALPTSDSTRKDATQTNSAKTARSSVKSTVQSHSKDTATGSVSRLALGTSNSSTLINGAKPAPAGSSPSPDPTVKKSNISVIGSSSRNFPASGLLGKAAAVSHNPTGKAQPANAELAWSSTAQPTSNSSEPSKMAPNANAGTSLKVSSSASKVARPFPMAVPSRTEKNEPDSKSLPFVKLSALGKRKDSSSPLPSGQSSSSSQSRLKKRKIATSSSDESEGPRFTVNPFDRRAKQMELTRKGVSGEAFQVEMKKWMHAKKAEWKEKERQREKQSDRSSGNNEVRTAIAEGKPVSELVRHRLAGGSTSTRIGEAKLARRKVYNSDWGMDVAKVSVAGSSEKRTLVRAEAGTEKRDPIVKDSRESLAAKFRRELDASRDSAKPRRVAA